MTADVSDRAERLRSRNAELRREVDALRRFMDALQVLVEALDHPRSDEDVMSALSDALQCALAAVGAEQGALLVLDEDSDELVVVLGHGEVEPWRRSPASAGLTGWTLRNGEGLIVNEADADERFAAAADQPGRRRVGSVMAVPVVGHDRTLGVLEIVNKHDHGLFDADDQALLALMGRFTGELLLRMGEHGAPPAAT